MYKSRFAKSEANCAVAQINIKLQKKINIFQLFFRFHYNSNCISLFNYIIQKILIITFFIFIKTYNIDFYFSAVGTDCAGNWPVRATSCPHTEKSSSGCGKREP